MWWLTAALVLLASCTSSPTPDEPTDSGAADPAAVSTAIARINAASTALAEQQRVLRDLAHPDFRQQQVECAGATVTIRLDAVLTDLRADPSWIPAGSFAPPRGTLYRVPALVEVFTDGLRTGTDLTLLRFSVIDGQARTFPICLV